MRRRGVPRAGHTERWVDHPVGWKITPQHQNETQFPCRMDESRIYVRCRLCDSNRLLSVLDLGATPPCETFLTADELDLVEPTFPLHLRLCEDCLLLQIPALITPEDTFSEYAYFSSYSDSWVQHAKRFVDDTVSRLGLGP